MNHFMEKKKKSGVALDLNNLLKADKAALNEIVSDLVERVFDGWADPMDAMIYAKKGEYVFKNIIDGIKKKVTIQEGKSYSKHNAVMVEKMTGVRYDFSNCGDPEWDDLNFDLDELKEKMKSRESYLKLITKPKTELNPETGEVYEINPPIKKGSLSIQFTLK